MCQIPIPVAIFLSGNDLSREILPESILMNPTVHPFNSAPLEIDPLLSFYHSYLSFLILSPLTVPVVTIVHIIIYFPSCTSCCQIFAILSWVRSGEGMFPILGAFLVVSLTAILSLFDIKSNRFYLIPDRRHQPVWFVLRASQRPIRRNIRSP